MVVFLLKSVGWQVQHIYMLPQYEKVIDISFFKLVLSKFIRSRATNGRSVRLKESFEYL